MNAVDLAVTHELRGDRGPLMVSLWPSVAYRSQGRCRLTIKAKGGTTFSPAEQATLTRIFAAYASAHVDDLRDVAAGEPWAVYSQWGMHVDGHEAWVDILTDDVDQIVDQIDQPATSQPDGTVANRRRK